MKLRSTLLTLTAATVFAAASTHAHDPSLHDDAPKPAKLKPTTCAQLADTARYTADLTDVDVKALKTRCDAEKKAKKAGAKAEPVKSN